MDSYTVTFSVAAKSQSSNTDGSTQYVTIMSCETGGVVGALTINTGDATLDSFFPIDGSFNAVFTVS